MTIINNFIYTNSIAENKQEILSFFNESRFSPSPIEIVKQLKKKSITYCEYEVIQLLCALQKDGDLEFYKGRWKLKKSDYYNYIISPDRVNIPSYAHPVSTVFQGTDSSDWSPTTSKFLSAPHSQTNHEIEINQDTPTPTTVYLNNGEPSWEIFRRLANYYADCIKNDGASEVSSYFSQLNQDFICLSNIGQWYPKGGIPWKISIPLSSDISQFLRNTALRGESSSLFLGYPIQIFIIAKPGEPDITFIKPVFTYQVSWEIHPLFLSVESEYPIPEINFDWLKFALKNIEQQKMFLGTCGVLNKDLMPETGMMDSSYYKKDTDLETIARGIETFFPELLRESIKPDAIRSHFPVKLESGIYNKAVLMVGKKTKYTENLIRELKTISMMPDEELEKSALKYIFKVEPNNATLNSVKTNSSSSYQENDSRQHEEIVIDTAPLNHEQRKAVSSIITNNLTVITGTPGTGKSQVVSSGMLNCRLKDQTVLFASRNHKAIDSVEHRLITSDSESLIVRANSKDDPYLKLDFSTMIKRLLLETYDEQMHKQFVSSKLKIEALLKRRGDYAGKALNVQKIKEEIGEVEYNISELQQDMSDTERIELNQKFQQFPYQKISELLHSLKSWENLNNSNKILQNIKAWFLMFKICSQMERINKIMDSNFGYWKFPETSDKKSAVKELCIGIDRWTNAVRSSEIRYTMMILEKEMEQIESEESFESLVIKIKESSDKLMEISDSLLIAHLRKCKGLSPDTSREDLASLQSALKTINQPVIEKSAKAAITNALNSLSPLVLNHFPLWAVTNLSVASRIPLVAGLFDSAVIDEASQCDIPSAIPILFRAKRAAVIGDPNQLTHITSLNPNKETLFRKRNGVGTLALHRFSYSDTSLFDLLSYTNGVNTIFLNDTYRSVHSIAEYSNRYFYDGKLRVATNLELCKIPKGFSAGIHWTDVESEIKSSGSSGCFAPEEINVVESLVSNILLDNNFEGTIGIVSPFRQQANRIQDRLFKKIPPEKREHSKLIIDTSHGFQGDERDVIILSLCAGPNMPQGSKFFLGTTGNLMNVAVSRARAVLHIVGNRNWAENSEYPHIMGLTKTEGKHNRSKEIFKSKWYPHESPWEEILYNGHALMGTTKNETFDLIVKRS
ncbi:MAG: DUF2075 domain-containing protein [Desulfamplus sp.]|nr:DUF2075 domain-containing protein [Desulfamplus sp.]